MYIYKFTLSDPPAGQPRYATADIDRERSPPT
jgi:hypothetical protein